MKFILLLAITFVCVNSLFVRNYKFDVYFKQLKFYAKSGQTCIENNQDEIVSCANKKLENFVPNHDYTRTYCASLWAVVDCSEEIAKICIKFIHDAIYIITIYTFLSYLAK